MKDALDMDPSTARYRYTWPGCIYKVSHLHTRTGTALERTKRLFAQIGAINFGLPTNDLKLTLN